MGSLEVKNKRSLRRARLYDQLVALFLSSGFADFTVEEIAANLRCSKSTLYEFAASKEQLVLSVVTHFFKSAAIKIEERTEKVSGPRQRIETYLAAISDQLSSASPKFYADLAFFEPGRKLYEQNTRIAAKRVTQLINDGVRSGEFREVQAEFVANVVTHVMYSIQEGAMFQGLHISDSDAYAELTSLLLHGIGS